jgi:tetratricopeptide (TPR) repeat protein
MVSETSTELSDCTGFFRDCILINLQYWQDYLTDQIEDINALSSERDRIVKAISFGLDLEEAWPSVYRLTVKFSSYMERGGHWQTWNRLLDQAVFVAQQAEDKAGEITLSALFARLLQRQNEIKPAITFYRRTIMMARQVGNDFEQARALTNLGYLFVEQGHWSRAEILCCRALAIFEAIDNDHGQAHTHNHLGILYIRQKNWDWAQQHLERACAIWRSSRDDHGLMYGLINLGHLYIEREWPHKALPYLDEALYQAKLTGDETYIGLIYINMSVVYRLDKTLEEAEAYAEQAETIFRRFSDSLGLAQAWCNQGLIQIERGKLSEAIWYLKSALETFRDLKNEQGEIEALVGLIKLELVRENHQNADNWLVQLERIITRPGRAAQFEWLKLRLKKYRRSLRESSTQQTAADTDSA